MYTRNYFEGGEGGMPRGYDGVALRSDPMTEAEDIAPREVTHEETKEVSARHGGGIFNGKPGGGIFGGILDSLHLSLPSLDKIGYEELLIIGIAAFLFFSADGDKECALILLALLLIN